MLGAPEAARSPSRPREQATRSRRSAGTKLSPLGECGCGAKETTLRRPDSPPLPSPGSFRAGPQLSSRFRLNPASCPPPFPRPWEAWGPLALHPAETSRLLGTLPPLLYARELSTPASGCPNPAASPHRGPPCLFPAALRFKFNLGCETKLLSGFVAEFNMDTHVFTFPLSLSIEEYFPKL